MEKSLDAPTVCYSSLIWEDEGLLNQLHNALSVERILLSNANGCILLKLMPKGLDCRCWVLTICRHRSGTLWDLQGHKLINRDTGHWPAWVCSRLSHLSKTLCQHLDALLVGRRGKCSHLSSQAAPVEGIASRKEVEGRQCAARWPCNGNARGLRDHPSRANANRLCGKHAPAPSKGQ